MNTVLTLNSYENRSLSDVLTNKKNTCNITTDLEILLSDVHINFTKDKDNKLVLTDPDQRNRVFDFLDGILLAINTSDFSTNEEKEQELVWYREMCQLAGSL